MTNENLNELLEHGKEVDRIVSKRIKMARKKHIYEKAAMIATELGTLKSLGYEYPFKCFDGRSPDKIPEIRVEYDAQIQSVKISYRDEPVFLGSQDLRPLWQPKAWSHTPTWCTPTRYIPGIWESYLDRIYLDAKSTKEERLRKDAEEKREYASAAKKGMLTELIKNFGINKKGD
ncbi:hypothetical protein M1316_01325 [Candidatus Parvarchaeota archaeon]|nr:hypothetical protein [Candidatus Parvarchaeota archaeon]